VSLFLSQTSERSFSTTRRLLAYLRIMGQDRPNGLAHLTINRDVTAVPEIVIDELSKKKRRLNFVLYLYPQILC